MKQLILTRVGTLVPVLFFTSVFTFVLVKLMPVDPVALVLGEGASETERAAYAAELGLDQPVLVQYLAWCWSAIQGDLGESLLTRQAVTQMIADRIGVTISLSLVAVAFAVVLGLTVGVYAARREGSLADRVLTGMLALWIAVPSFWLGLMLAVVFGVTLEWFPVIGYTPFAEDPVAWFRALVLPGIALGLHAAAVIARQTRAAMRDADEAQFTRALRARGVAERRITTRYTLKNAMLPILAAAGVQVPIIVGGSMVIERVFSQAGLGTLLIDSVQRSDMYVLQGGILVVVLFVLVLNLLIDITYGMLNPKVQVS